MRIAMRALILMSVLTCAVPAARAQGYRHRYVQPAPVQRHVRLAPRVYYSAPRRGTTYYTYPYGTSSAYGYVEHDTRRPHWTFDENAWMSHNF